jgi:hypothetical protein
MATTKCVVLGSSPISVLIAIKLANEGKRVTIVEKNEKYGGAWKSAKIDDTLITESACHLIEHYHDVYGIISELSGIKFEYYNPQPIKIYNDGQEELYTDKREFKSLLLNHLKIFIKIPTIGMIKLLNIVLPKRMRISKVDRISYNDLKSMVNTLLFFIRHKAPAFLSYNGLMHPVCGFTYFADTLIRNAKAAGVEVICDEISNIEIQGNENLISFRSGGCIVCKMLYLPESSELMTVKSIEKVLGSLKKISKTTYWHILIILHNNIDQYKVPRYIHLPDNIFFHRITSDRRRLKNSGFQFLMQTRFNPANNMYDLKAIISEILLKTRICSENPQFDIIKVFSEELLASKKDCIFRSARVYNTITVFPSIGDLARNIAINPFFRNN